MWIYLYMQLDIHLWPIFQNYFQQTFQMYYTRKLLSCLRNWIHSMSHSILSTLEKFLIKYVMSSTCVEFTGSRIDLFKHSYWWKTICFCNIFLILWNLTFGYEYWAAGIRNYQYPTHTRNEKDIIWWTHPTC